MKIFLIIFLFFISTSVLGAENADSSTPRHNIHQTCETSYDLCLALIPEYLNETPIYSRLWYAYKLYQIEALSALERFDESEKELLPFISKKDLPEKFHIYSHILYAKIIEYKGDSVLALSYFNEAKELLLAVNKDWPKPLELIKIANMLFYMKQYQIGYEMLLGLDEKFMHFSDANFKYRLYTNLGHFALQFGEHQNHIQYRFKALDWAKQLTNKNMKAIAVYNVARSHFFIENYDTALIYFEKTIPFANQAKNLNLLNNAYLNMADIYYKIEDKSKVKEILTKVMPNSLSGSYIELFKKLSQIE